jgi:putative hemolysin
MVLGELVPKRIAMKKANVIAFPISGSILIVSRIFAPLVWLLTKSTNGLLRLIGINPEADTLAVTEEEIRLMIDVGSAGGTIERGEREIINNVFEFNDKSAGEVMTHRRDTVLLRLDDTDEEWEKVITGNKHGFFPVCGRNQDDIAGVLKSRDYFRLKDRLRESVMAAVEPAQLVPNTVKTNVLFKRMKMNRNHFAVVLDEHGSMMGIVTMKDLLEELVGDLGDDSSSPPEQPLIEKTGPETWIVSGAVSLDKAAQVLDIPLPVERHDTFAGFVFSLLGRIPEDGCQEELETEGLKIKILEIREHRLERARVTKLANRDTENTER